MLSLYLKCISCGQCIVESCFLNLVWQFLSYNWVFTNLGSMWLLVWLGINLSTFFFLSCPIFAPFLYLLLDWLFFMTLFYLLCGFLSGSSLFYYFSIYFRVYFIILVSHRLPWSDSLPIHIWCKNLVIARLLFLSSQHCVLLSYKLLLHMLCIPQHIVIVFAQFLKEIWIIIIIIIK